MSDCKRKKLRSQKPEEKSESRKSDRILKKESHSMQNNQNSRKEHLETTCSEIGRERGVGQVWNMDKNLRLYLFDTSSCRQH